MSTNHTREVSPLHMRAAVGSIDPKTRRAEITWSTGAKVLRSGWGGQFYEELSMDPKSIRMGRLTSGTAPFLMNHDGGSVAATLGVVESARLENGKGYATVRFAAEGIDPTADMVFAKIRDGVITNVSVGYRTWAVEETDGVDTAIPTRRAVDWEPYEISAVAMGADEGAGFRSEAKTNPCTWFVHSTRGTKMELQNKEAEDIKRVEVERVAGIRHAVKIGHLGDEVADRLIKSGAGLADCRGAVLEMLAVQSDAIRTDSHLGFGAITGGEDESEKFARGAVSSLLMRTVPDLVRAAKAKGVEGFEQVDTGPSEYRSHGLLEFARLSLERQGVKTRSLGKMDLAGKAFTLRSGPYAGTADFPVLLENTLGKILMAAYATTPDTWSRICKTESVDDFRASPRYRAGSFGVLDSISENGEFKNKAIPDGNKLSISTATKGNIVAISRQLVINDDMAALSDLLAKLGRAARLSIEVDFYAQLALNAGLGPTMGANPFFHATNGNVNAVASDITALGIDADRVVMLNQKDAQSNEFLDMRPAVLLVPSGKGAQAKILNTSAINPDANAKIQQPNAAQGLFRDVVDSPRITGTRRYLFADASVAPAFVVAFLQGQQSPVLESELGWRVDGTEMKVRFDYLVQPFDVKGALTNAGV